VALSAIAAVACFALSAWWPDGDYTPIRPGERGTVGEAVRSIPEIARPAREAAGAATQLPWTGEVEQLPAQGAAEVPRDAREPLTVRERDDAPAGEDDDPTGWWDEPAAPEETPAQEIGSAPTPAPVSGGETITNEGTAAPPPAGATPAPTAAPPAPTETPAPTPSPAATTEPTPETTPEPTPDTTPEPTPSPTPTPSETATPAPAETAAPTPTPTP
jgi:hypothetical protein